MIDFISQHRDDILDHTQEPMPWFNETINKLKEHNALNGIRKDDISRKDVIDYYLTDPYMGFIATMLWGGKHNGKYKKGFHEIIDIPKENINNKLIRVKGLLEQKNVCKAFVSMCGNGIKDEKESNNIKNIGPAFFTKILYFMSKAFVPNNTPMPLILDSHMMYIHCALMIDYNEDIEKYYKWYDDNKGNKGVTWLRTSSDFKSDVYLDYINRMHTISQEIGCSADKLEAYLFDNISVSPTSDIYKKVKKNLTDKNTPITNKKERNNTNITRANNPLITQENASFPLSLGSSVSLEYFKPFYVLNNKWVHHDKICKGLIAKIDDEPFMLFVGHYGNRTGFFFQIRYCYEKDKDKDIMKNNTVRSIVNKYEEPEWINTLPSYKYRKFGNNVGCEKNALRLMKSILKDINAPIDVLDSIECE